MSDPNLDTLLKFRFRRRFKAQEGGDGKGGLKHGYKGASVDVPVPVGTEIWAVDGQARLVADVVGAGRRVLVARGGRGGRGNARFVSSRNQFPLLAEAGEWGEDLNLRLELKLLADVGLIGAPNAGKSSLLAAISAARPKIGAYPFTTLEPVLGVVEHRGVEFVAVDIPGLIEGAHDGVGLGHDFLRHVGRARVLVHVVDGSVGDPFQQYHQTNEELRQFSQELTDKPQVIAVNKLDLPEVRERVSVLQQQLSGNGVPAAFVSAATREGVGLLLDTVLEVLNSNRGTSSRAQPAGGPIEEEPVLLPPPRGEPVAVTREGTMFVVRAPGVARVAAMVDRTNWNAWIQFSGYIERKGVVVALRGAGIAPGDTVRLGELEWEWE